MPTTQRRKHSGWRSRRRSTTAALSVWRPPEGLILATAAVGLIYAAHILYGALVSDVAMAASIGAAVIVAFALFDPWLRADLLRLKGLAWPALAMALTILAAILSLTPWSPGGPHPVWDYVNAPLRSATLDRSTTLVEIVKLLGLSCMFLAGAAAGGSDGRARTALNLVAGFGALFGLWFFFAFVTGSIYQTQPRRLEAAFLNPNTAGTVFGVLLVLSAGMLARRIRAVAPDARLWACLPLACAVLVFLGCLIATASRAAFVATLVALLFLAVSQVASGRWNARSAAMAAFAALGVGGVALALAGGVLMTRILGTGDDVAGRTFVWKTHWEAFLAAPLSGYGAGVFETVNKTLITAANFPELWNSRAAMNVYLQWLEQTGLIGALPMFVCIGLILASAFRGALRRSRMTGPLFALLAADLLVLVHGATDFALETPSVSMFWAFLLGLQFALAQGSGAR
jgi:O-antigen ligase